MNSKKLKTIILNNLISGIDIENVLKSLVNENLINAFFIKNKTNSEKNNIEYKLKIITEKFNTDLLITKKDIRKIKLKKLKEL